MSFCVNGCFNSTKISYETTNFRSVQRGKLYDDIICFPFSHDKVGWSASNTSTEEKEPKIRNSNTEMKVPPRPKKAQTVAKAIAKESGHNAGRASNNQKKPEQKK